MLCYVFHMNEAGMWRGLYLLLEKPKFSYLLLLPLSLLRQAHVMML
jgi:hypothetical protein